MRDAPRFDPYSEGAFAALQNQIVEPRYAEASWRSFQNFIGSTGIDLREQVHSICPRPEDVGSLMRGWMDLLRRVLEAGMDPIVAAAVTAFAFVFIHPFGDGNGRIHRFLIHHVLGRARFGPEGLVFPVSAAILRDRAGYDSVLSAFSEPLFASIDWGWSRGESREIEVGNETADLYRFFDATAVAEDLHDKVAETIRTDLKEELGFLVRFDRACEAVRAVVDMPDRRLGLLIRMLMQNEGRLSKAKRGQFPELSDEEVMAMERAVAEVGATGP